MDPRSPPRALQRWGQPAEASLSRRPFSTRAFNWKQSEGSLLFLVFPFVPASENTQITHRNERITYFLLDGAAEQKSGSQHGKK